MVQSVLMVEIKDIDPNPRTKAMAKAMDMDVVTHKVDCKFWGSKCPPRECPAYGQQCNKCNGKNHFGRVCRSWSRSQSSGCDKGKDKCQSRSKNMSKNRSFTKVTQSDSDDGQFDDI